MRSLSPTPPRSRRLREGIPIPPALDRHIREICEHSGTEYLLQGN